MIPKTRAIFELAITQKELDMPEVLWKTYIDFEVDLGEIDNARSLYRWGPLIFEGEKSSSDKLCTHTHPQTRENGGIEEKTSKKTDRNSIKWAVGSDRWLFNAFWKWKIMFRVEKKRFATGRQLVLLC